MQQLKPELNFKIKETAINLFFSRGYQNASMRDIARIVKTSVGNLYRYYKNKEELFIAISAPVYEGIKDIIVDAKNGQEDHLALPYLMHTLSAFSHLAQSNQKLMVVFLEYYSNLNDPNVLHEFEALIISTMQEHLPKLHINLARLIYHFLLKGVIYILRNEEGVNVEIALEKLFIFIFKDIEGRI